MGSPSLTTALTKGHLPTQWELDTSPSVLSAAGPDGCEQRWILCPK